MAPHQPVSRVVDNAPNNAAPIVRAHWKLCASSGSCPSQRLPRRPKRSELAGPQRPDARRVPASCVARGRCRERPGGERRVTPRAALRPGAPAARIRADGRCRSATRRRQRCGPPLRRRPRRNRDAPHGHDDLAWTHDRPRRVATDCACGRRALPQRGLRVPSPRGGSGRQRGVHWAAGGWVRGDAAPTSAHRYAPRRRSAAHDRSRELRAAPRRRESWSGGESGGWIATSSRGTVGGFVSGAS